MFVTINYQMEELNYVPLAKFEIEPSMEDKFWEEKVKRSIEECNSVGALKEMAILLAKIATQRQGIIKGLVKDIRIFNQVIVDPNDLTNPDLQSEWIIFTGEGITCRQSLHINSLRGTGCRKDFDSFFNSICTI